MKPVLPFAVLTSVLLTGCSSQGGERSVPSEKVAGPAQSALRQVALPDLAPMSPSVQKQIREHSGALTRLERDPAAPRAELASAYGEMGKVLMAAESYAEAEPFFLNAAELVPGEVRWPYYLAHLFRLRGELSQAAAYYERALQIRPDETVALVWLGDVYLDQGQPERAALLFEKALANQPRLAAARFGLGRAALATRDFGRAVEHLEAALALDPGASVIHYPLAMAYRGLGQADRAEAHARRRGGVEIGRPDPLMQEVFEALHSAVAYENRGDRAFARGAYAIAAEEFRKGLELAPDTLSVRQKLATTLSLTGDIAGAVRQFQEVLRRSPTFAPAHYSLGVLLLADGQDAAAIQRFAAAVRYDATYLEARLQLANALRRRGRSEDALRQYAEVTRLDPRIAEARFGRAMALVRLRRYRDARDSLADAMSQHPDRPGFAHALARLLASAPDEQVRNGRQALALAQDLLKGPQTVEVRETMAMTLAEIGEYEEAVNWQREAIAAARQLGRPELASQLDDNLQRYQRRQPCRTPWREDLPWEGG